MWFGCTKYWLLKVLGQIDWKILLIQIFSHRDYRSEQSHSCAPSCVAWFGFFLPKPEVKNIGRSSAGTEGCYHPGGRQLLAARFVLQSSEQGWHPQQELLHAAAPWNASQPSHALPLHPKDLVLEHVSADCAADAICIQQIFKAQWFRLTNVFSFPNMFSSHLCCVFPWELFCSAAWEKTINS